MIRKIAIRNYRRFREFDLDLSSEMNILVGRNDTGKSTLIEAIALALTGRLHGRPIEQELSPYLINKDATREYAASLNSAGPPLSPPTIIIEIYFGDLPEAAILKGTNNLHSEDTCGVRFQARISQDFEEEYRSFISSPSAVGLVPTEYYNTELLGFSGNRISARSIPLSVSLIDPSSIRLQSGVDYHLQNIIRTHLQPGERVELSRQYRSLREDFSNRETVRDINTRLMASSEDLTERKFSLSVDISQRYTWESSLTAHLDDLPFRLIGKGDQSALKTLLAIDQRADDAHIVLIEEPENHLSHDALRRLISRISEKCIGKQVVVATHSNYVLNKLGLHDLILLGDDRQMRVTDLPQQTVEYFKKLAGFDTLRLVLAEGAFLVEGPSDELIVQRAYKDVHGKLPIEDGIEVISVGLSHKRFLDIAIPLQRRVWVLTDNDHKSLDEVKDRFSDYLQHDFVSLHVSDDPDLHTLEPNIVAANDLQVLNSVLGARYPDKEAAVKGMLGDKTTAALAIFEATQPINMPKYIADAVAGA